MQPAWTQVPPSRPRSMRTTSAPARRPARAAATPAGPPPTTTRSAMADRRLEGRPDVDHSRSGQGHRRGRAAIHGQLPFAVERDGAGVAAERDRLAELEQPPVRDLDAGYHSGCDGGEDLRPVPELHVEAGRLVGSERAQTAADGRQADRPGLR